MAYADVDRFAEAAEQLDLVLELNRPVPDLPDATRRLIRHARLLLTLARSEKVLAGWCRGVHGHSDQDGWRSIRAALRPYVGTADSGASIYDGLEWRRVRPDSDDHSPAESSAGGGGQ